MQESKTGRAVPQLDTVASALEQTIENEPALLDLLAQALAKGASPGELWDMLHQAAHRDNRIAELAAAYDAICRDRKIRLLQPAAQIELLLSASAFLVDYAGDGATAQPHLERVMQLSPGNVDAFQRLEAILRDREDWTKLAELYTQMAAHRPDKQEQLAFLRAAVQILAALPGEEDKAFKLHQQILRLDPTDADSRNAMAERFIAAGRFADVAKLYEQAIAADPPPAEEDLLALREQAIELYSVSLHEIEKALPHAEEVLKKNPDSELAWRTCEQLLTHKTLAARAAAAIENVFMSREQYEDAARMLTIQIDSVRGPRRLEAQKRLAALQYQHLGDLGAAFTLYEGILTVDPNDDEVRARYRSIGAALDRRLDVTRVLTRASAGAKDPLVRAKIAADLGELFLETGDPKRARASFQSAVDAGLAEDAGVRAARALVDLCEQASDWSALAAALDRLSDIEPEPDARAGAAERLARLREETLGDAPGAIAAYRKLVGTSLESDALPALERLYEAAGDEVSLADVLERRAALETDREAARDLAFRAADLRAARSNDLGAVLDGWRRFLQTYGPTREIHARILPLLEREQRWEELAQTLDAEAGLAPSEERIAILAKLAQVRLSRLADGAGALDAYRQALDLDRSDKTCRQAVERMLGSGDHRLGAADVLEPIYREEGAAQGLLKILEVRGDVAKEASDRLAALREAAQLAEGDLGDTKRALQFAGLGLRIATNDMADDVPEWLSVVERLAGDDAARRAGILIQALGNRNVDHPAIAELAKATGEALAIYGDFVGALSVFRNALAFEPSSPDLITRIDALLQKHGNAQERLALYKGALAATTDPDRRRQIFHSIGTIERRGLRDLAAAAATYRRALEEDAGDRGAYEALLDVLEEGSDAEGLYAALASGVERAADAEERAAITLRMANLSASRGWIERARQHYRSLLDEGTTLSDETLDRIAELARKAGDNDLYRVLLERRISTADGPLAEARWLEHLAALKAEAFGDTAAAIEDYRRAGDLADGGGDGALAERLFERVLALSADDREAAERLVDLYRRSEAWEKLPAVYEVLFRTAADAAERADKLLAFEDAAIHAKATTRFVGAADALLADEGALDVGPREALQAARARVLAADPDRQEDAAAAYRSMIQGASDPWTAVEAFEAFLDRSPPAQARLEDRRWVLGFRLQRAEGDRRIEALLAWAAAEENVFKDPRAAADLYARVLEQDPQNDAALAARGRLLLDVGDVEGAAAMMAARRDLREGAERTALELELATLLLDRLGRVDEALAAVEPVLEAEPGNEGALVLLERALARPESRRRAAELLERACDTTDDESIAARILKLLIATPADASDLVDLRAGWFTRLLDRPGAAPEIALDLAVRAVEELPYDAALWDRAEQLGRDADRPDLVAEAYRKKLESDSVRELDPDTLDDLGRRSVDYHEEFFFDDQDAVMKLLRRVVDVAPDALWAFERLKLAYNQNERWADLFSLYDQAIERTDDKFARVELLEDAAESAKDLAGDPDRAVQYLEQLLPLKPRDKKIRTSLERLYERLGRHRPLIDLLSHELASLDVEAAQKLRARIATLWLDGVAEPDAAFRVVEEMLSVEPSRAEALDLLERVLAATGSAEPLSIRPSAEAENTARQRAAVVLERRYRNEERHEDLARVLAVRLEAAVDPTARGALLREIVSLRADVLDDPASALESLAALVALEPAEPSHRVELERLAARVDRFDRLAEVLVTVSEGAPGALKIELLSRASAIYVEKLGDRGRAIDLGRTILSLEPEHPELVVGPARDLERLLAEEGRSAERCEVLERLARLEKDPDARRATLLEVARIASSELGDKPRAIAAYRARLADEPRDLDALGGLSLDLESESRFGELAEVLERRAELTEGDAARQDLVRVAAICDQELRDVARAITVWEGVRARFDADDESCDALARLLEKAARWPDLVELLRTSATQADEAGTNVARAAELYRRLGDVQRDRTGQWAEAVASYEAAIRCADPGGLALSGLESLLSLIDLDDEARRPILAAAVRVLTSAYAASGDWQRTIDLLEPRLAAATSAADRTAILTETASLHEHRRSDPSAAFDAVWRAFAAVKTPELSAEVLRLAATADRWADVADAFPAIEAQGDVPPDVARALWWSVALWHRDRRGDARAAEIAIERALTYDPTNAEMLAALVELRRHTPGKPLVDALLRLSEVSADALPLHREAVTVASDHVGDPSLAKSIAEAMLQKAEARWLGEGSDPLSEAATFAAWALDVLVRICRDEGDLARVVALCLDGAKLPFESSRRRSLRLAAAEISDAQPAIAIYEELFGEDPTDELVGSRLEELYRKEGRRAELLTLRERQISVTDDVLARVDLRVDLAFLLVESGDADRAIGSLRKNLEESPSHAPTVDKLAELFGERGDHGALAALWEDQAARREADRDTAAAAELWRRAAIIAETRVGDLPRAISDYRRAARYRDMASLDALARLFTARGDHAAAAEVLETICTDAPADASPHPVLRLAEAYIASGEPALAQQRLEEAQGRVADPAPLRARLSVLYREAEAWGPLAELIAIEAAHTENAAKRTALLREAADLHFSKRNKPEAAVPLLEQAAQLTPDDRAIKLSLCDALSAAGRSDEASNILRQIIDAYGSRRPKDRAIVHYYLARVFLSSGDRKAALAELDVALKIDPTHPEILLALARLSFDEGQFDRAQRTYRSLLMMVRRLRDEQGTPAVTRTEVLIALAEIADRQGDPDRSAEHVESAFEASRESPDEADRLVRALRGRQNHALLARALELRLEGAGGDAAATAPVLAELASLYEQHLGRAEDALSLWLRALAVRPTSADAHRSALGLARRLGAVERYLDALRKLVAATTVDPPLVDLLLHLGRALSGEGGDAAQADEAFRRAEALLLERPGDRRIHEVWRALEASCEQRGDREGQIALLEKRIAAASESAPPAELADGLYRLAELALREPGGAARGVPALERALSLDASPDRAEAIFRLGLQREENAALIAPVFERFARKHERPRALVDALVLLAPERGADLYREAVSVAEGLGDTALVESVLRRALTREEGVADTSDDLWALVALAKVRAAAEDWAEARALEERAARVSAPGDERGHLLAAASIARDKLGDLAGAARLYAELFEREPADRDLWGPLADLYRSLGEDESLGRLIEQVVPLLETVEDRSRMRLERARLAQKREGGADEAISALTELLDDDPANEEAATLLSDLLSAAGRFEDLASLLERRIDLAKDREDTVGVASLSMRLGALLEQQGESARARDAYHGILDWDATNLDALRSIVRICEKAEDPSELADALEKLLGAEKGEAAEATAQRLAAIRAEQGDEDGVDRALEAGYRAFQTSTVLGVKLKERFESREDFRKVADVYQIEAEGRTSKEDRVGCLRKAAAILRDKEQDLPGAIEILKRALDIDPLDRALVAELVGAQSEMGDHQLAAASIASAAANVEGVAAVELLLHAARLLLATPEGASAAVELVEDARRRQPDAWEPVIVLAEAYVAAGRVDEARPLATNAVAAYEGRRSRTLAAAHRALAHVERASGNDDAAFEQLSKAFDNDAASAEIALELGQFAVDRGEHDVASRALRAVTMMKITTPGSAEGTTSRGRALAYFHLGRLAVAQGDRGKARLLVEKALAEDANLDAARDLADELASG
ncbi:tetratricopeptide repeat protein [Polyangium jinanense]|uniref:Tetratricopeptide repeat protein n=2 Tax=Polyangium jinanense TaxID=2829994 RepID=A0A9X4ATK5_9BACT|nr:tetratricopeptide repeat protein [Polyangium jinanense]